MISWKFTRYCFPGTACLFFSYEYISVSAPVPLQNGIRCTIFKQITRSDMFQEEALVRDPTDSFTSRP